MAQLYVMVPGKDQPQLLEVDELVKKIKAGEVPDTANVARLGETTWSPAKDLPEVKEKLEGGAPQIPATSTSFPSIPGAQIGSQAGAPSPLGSQAGTPSPLGSQAGTPSPFGTPAAAAPATAKKGVPKSALIGGGAAFAVLLIGVIGLVIFRGLYSRGLVLEHLPEDCAEVYYVDIAGVLTSDPIKDHFAKFYKNSKDLAEDDLSKKSKKDKERFEKTIEALRKHGVDETSIREVAVCIPPRDDDDKGYGPDYNKTLIVVGGTFRRGNVLQGLKEATETALKDEDSCKLEDDDGLQMLKCSAELKGSKKEPIYATLVESRVLAISLDKKMVKGVRTAKDRSKTYGANKGEHVVIFRAKESPGYDGQYGESKLKIGATDTVLTVETHYDAVKGKKKLDQFKDGDELVKKKEKYFKDAADKCFDKTPFDMFAESLERTKIEAFDDGLRYEYKVSNKDLGKAFKVLSDADKEDMSKAGRAFFCVTSTVEPYVSNY